MICFNKYEHKRRNMKTENLNTSDNNGVEKVKRAEKLVDKVKKRNKTIGQEGKCFHRVDGADCVAPLAFVAYASLENNKSFEAEVMTMRIMI